MRRISVKAMFLLVETGAAVSMLVLTFILSAMTGQGWVLLAGALLTACALVWMFLLTLFFAERLSQFTSNLCQTMDNMISGGEAPERVADRDTIFARISHLLSQLYHFPSLEMGLFLLVLFGLEFLLSAWMAGRQRKQSLMEQMRAAEQRLAQNIS